MNLGRILNIEYIAHDVYVVSNFSKKYAVSIFLKGYSLRAIKHQLIAYVDKWIFTCINATFYSLPARCNSLAQLPENLIDLKHN